MTAFVGAFFGGAGSSEISGGCRIERVWFYRRSSAFIGG
jgi:hypothetical protein